MASESSKLTNELQTLLVPLANLDHLECRRRITYLVITELHLHFSDKEVVKTLIITGYLTSESSKLTNVLQMEV